MYIISRTNIINSKVLIIGKVETSVLVHTKYPIPKVHVTMVTMAVEMLSHRVLTEGPS